MELRKWSRVAVGLVVGLVACAADPNDDPAATTTTTTAALTTGTAVVDYPKICNQQEGFPDTQCTVKQAGGTNYTTMHCCPLGYAMQGFYNMQPNDEALYCRAVSYNQGSNDGQSDRTNCVWRTQQRTFHSLINGNQIAMNSCSSGEYMIGIQQQYNRIACCPSGQSVTEWPDGSGYNNGGPTQTTNSYLVRYGGAYVCENPETMHTCGDESGSGTALMEGIRTDYNIFACAD
jgi:hypothetical protein